MRGALYTRSNIRLEISPGPFSPVRLTPRLSRFSFFPFCFHLLRPQILRFSLSVSLARPFTPLLDSSPSLSVTSYRAASAALYSEFFSLSPLSIAFCIAHPQASVHYRKYWISIMKYWMISDIRRAPRRRYSPQPIRTRVSGSPTSELAPRWGNCFACGSIFDN